MKSQASCIYRRPTWAHREADSCRKGGQTHDYECTRERESVCVRERECVCVCVFEREKGENERGKEKYTETERERNRRKRKAKRHVYAGKRDTKT
jgi:hypothetical protein